MVMAAMTDPTEGPFSATSAMASRIEGMAISASIIRMMIASAVRKKPAIMPITSPTRTETTAVAMPIISDSRPPISTRDRISRPKLSVPSGCPSMGPFRRTSGSMTSGSCGAIQGASNVTITMTASTKAAMRGAIPALGMRIIRRTGCMAEAGGGVCAISSGSLGQRANS